MHRKLVLEKLHHAGGEHPVLTGAAGRQGTFHALVGFHDGVHIGINSLADTRQQVQGIQDGESVNSGPRERGVLLVTGTVTAVVRNVERLEALRGLRIHNRIKLVGVHVVRGTVRVLGEESHGLFLRAQAEADHGQHQGGNQFFHR